MGVSSVIVSLAVLVAVSWASPYPSEQASNVSTTQNETSPSVQTTPPTLEQNLQGDKFNQFDWKLCKALAEAENGNVVISPISLKLVLAMVFEGASGNTARELESALGLIRENTGRQITRKKFSTIVGNLKSSEGEYELALGTSIFIDKSVTPKPTYVRKLQSFYEAQIEQVDFSNTPESIAAINAWAAGATKGQIQNFLSSGDASANTVLMLLNAIYFKGKWLYTFPLNQTAPGTFYAYGKTPVNVTFMNSAYYLSYLDATEINAQIVRLPYVGKKFAMYIIVPNNATGLPALVKEIDPFVLKKHTQNMYETLVELSLPSFTIEYTSNLGSILKQLGIKKLFGNDAELNEIAELANNSIAVSNVLQKAGIQVNEEGSTAFAATEAQVVNKFGDSPIVSLKVDRPFLFFIKDEETDTVLFVGNLVNPGGKAAKPDKVTPPVTKVTPPVTKVTEKTPVEPTVVPTKEEITTAVPPTTTSQNGIIADPLQLVKLYFLDGFASDEITESMNYYYLTGTTAYDLTEVVEFYIKVENAGAKLRNLIQFYLSYPEWFYLDDRLIKFYLLMKVTSEDSVKFLDYYFTEGNTSLDIESLNIFFSVKGASPDTILSLIQYYLNNKKNLR